jgi:hypothetical protein
MRPLDVDARWVDSGPVSSRRSACWCIPSQGHDTPIIRHSRLNATRGVDFVSDLLSCHVARCASQSGSGTWESRLQRAQSPRIGSKPQPACETPPDNRRHTDNRHKIPGERCIRRIPPTQPAMFPWRCPAAEYPLGRDHAPLREKPATIQLLSTDSHHRGFVSNTTLGQPDTWFTMTRGST